MWQGPPKSAAKLSAARKAVGFDRTVDGRVTLFSDDGEPFQVKNDMGVPGALLLRWARQCVGCLFVLQFCCVSVGVLLYVLGSCPFGMAGRGPGCQVPVYGVLGVCLCFPVGHTL